MPLHKSIAKLKTVLKGSFFKSLLMLLSGATVAQIIPTAISPILSRLYNPEHFGVLATFTSVTAVLIAVSTLQFESAILLPKRRGEAKFILGLSLMFPLMLGLLSAILIMVGNEALASALNLESAGWMFYLIPIFVIAGGWYNAMAGWFLREKQFKTLTIRQVGMSLGTAFSKLALGILKFLQVGLILGTLIGQLTSLFVFVYQLFKVERMMSFFPSVKSAKKLIMRYIDFAKYTTWQGFFDTISVAAVLWIFNHYLTIEEVGLYAFTLAIVQKPITLISTQVGKVYFQKVIELRNNRQRIFPFSLKIFIVGIASSLLLFTPIVTFSDEIFSLVFGIEWSKAGAVAANISPFIIFKFASRPLSTIPQLLNKNKQFFYVGIVRTLIPPIMYALLLNKIGFLESVLFVSISLALLISLIVYWLLKLTMEVDKEIMINLNR